MNALRTDFEAVASVAGWKIDGPDLELRLRMSRGKAARLIARAVSRETWKITVTPSGSPAPRPTLMVLPVETRPVRLKAKPDGDRLLVTGPELALEVRFNPFGWRFVDRDGHALLSDNPGDVDGLGRPSVPPLGFTAAPGGIRSVRASFRLRSTRPAKSS
jgi:hypothetical protein